VDNIMKIKAKVIDGYTCYYTILTQYKDSKKCKVCGRDCWVFWWRIKGWPPSEPLEPVMLADLPPRWFICLRESCYSHIPGFMLEWITR
jgi:hypothetical protein